MYENQGRRCEFCVFPRLIKAFFVLIGLKRGANFGRIFSNTLYGFDMGIVCFHFITFYKIFFFSTISFRLSIIIYIFAEPEGNNSFSGGALRNLISKIAFAVYLTFQSLVAEGFIGKRANVHAMRGRYLSPMRV